MFGLQSGPAAHFAFQLMRIASGILFAPQRSQSPFARLSQQFIVQ